MLLDPTTATKEILYELERFGLLNQVVIEVEFHTDPDPDISDIYHEVLPGAKAYEHYLVDAQVVPEPNQNPYLRFGPGVQRDLDVYIYEQPLKLTSFTPGVELIPELDLVEPHEGRTPKTDDFLWFVETRFHLVGVEPIAPFTADDGTDAQIGWVLMARKFQ